MWGRSDCRVSAGPSESNTTGSSSARTLADLTRSACKGDHAAFEAIHARVGPGLRRMLLSRSAGRDELVEELCQRVWTAVWKAMSEGKYDPSRSAITTFAYAVANNAWITHLRRFARDQGYIEGLPATTGSEALSGQSTREASIEELQAEAELVDRVRVCLQEQSAAGLTDLEREIVSAVAAGEGDRALARRLGLSSSTINVRKHAAYAKIRAFLGVSQEEPNDQERGANNTSDRSPL